MPKKKKYFTTDNIVKILFSLSLFFVVKTYNNIDNNIKYLKDKSVDNDKRLYLLEYKNLNLEKAIERMEAKK